MTSSCGSTRTWSSGLDDFFNLLESPHDVTAGLYMMESMKEFAAVKDWDTAHFAEHGSFKFLEPADTADRPRVALSPGGLLWYGLD